MDISRVGLTESDVRARQATHGRNELPQGVPAGLTILKRQFFSLFNLVLLAAGVVAFSLREYVDGAFIVFFILLSGTLGFFQEYHSNTAAQKLRTFLSRRTMVRRDNKEFEVPPEELVPGDIIILEPGDIVPADSTVLCAEDLLVDESTFSGEVEPVAKQVGEADNPDSMLLTGTHILTGRAEARVDATGTKTRYASIAERAGQVDDKSPFVVDVDKFGAFILKLVLLLLSLVVLANIVTEGAVDFPHLLIFAVALGVSVIPEALPVVTTFSLSRGALRLARENVVVRRLSAIEDLGSIDVLCTDKTGTLTENRLSLLNDFVENQTLSVRVAAALAAKDLDEERAEPFDLAIARSQGALERTECDTFRFIRELPFDPSLRRNAVVVERTGKTFLIVRGAPEAVFARAPGSRSEWLAPWMREEEEKGRRLLAVALRDITGLGENVALEENMELLGLLSFEDSLKPTTKPALDEARRLNVSVKIITGDAPSVARSVGKDIGSVVHDTEVVTAYDLLSRPLEEQRAMVDTCSVFARATPEDKLRIVKLLAERHTVGFLGEGINDSPALKAAAVGMVVAGASDIARETADLILTKQDLSVVVQGIRLGRETFVNTSKYIRLTLTSNFGNFFAIAIASLFVTFLPMLPSQLLLLNLLSDVPMMMIASDIVHRSEITRPHRFDVRDIAFVAIVLGFVSTCFDLLVFSLFVGEGEAVLQTNWFIASVVTELVLLFSLRSMLPLRKAGFPSEGIVLLTVLSMVTAVALPYLPVGQHIFSFTPPALSHLGILALMALLYLITTEAVKGFVVRFLPSATLPATTHAPHVK